jgi:hypothetical protein
MGQVIKTRVIECPHRKREVEVKYSVIGNFFNRDVDVLSCPAINDGDGGCDRRCKSLLRRPPSLGEWYSRQWLR